VLKALYCSAPGVLVVGLLQARRERKRGFQVPGVVAEDIVGELESKCVVRLVSCWVLLPVWSVLRISVCCRWCVFSCLPCGKGVHPPFIDQGRGESHARRAIKLREGA
jgi:hypothetical protein